MKKFSLKRRVFIISFLQGILLFLLVYRIFFLQIKKFHHFSKLSEKNSRVSIKVLGARGKIFDKNGVLIATNEKLFRVIIFTRNKILLEKTLNIVKGILTNRTFNSVEEILQKQKMYSCDICIIADNLSWNEMIKIEERRFDLPSIFIDAKESRFYLNDTKFAHIVGYVDSENDPKMGIEKLVGDEINGINGEHVFEINSTRNITQLVETKMPQVGKSTFTTLDYRIQSVVYDKLKENSIASSAVVMNANSGNVLAVASHPSFSPNKLTRSDTKEMQYAFHNKVSPMINRAFAGLYMPGSLMKMAIGLAALKYGVVDRNTTFNCDKFIEVGNHKFHCWSRNGHGDMNLESAMACSCDIYFYNVGQMLGVQKMCEMFKVLGINEIFDGIPDLKTGILPSDFPVKYAADTILTSIGHGNFSTTCMHMCVMLCRLLTNRKVVPQLFHGSGAQGKSKFASLGLNPNDLEIIMNGMDKAFNSEIGTGRFYKNHLTNMKMIGKTTTTQVVKVKRDEDGKKLLNQFRSWDERDHSMCCAAVDDYVISLIIDHGGWGRFSADLCAKIFQEMENQGIFNDCL